MSSPRLLAFARKLQAHRDLASERVSGCFAVTTQTTQGTPNVICPGNAPANRMRIYNATVNIYSAAASTSAGVTKYVRFPVNYALSVDQVP